MKIGRRGRRKPAKALEPLTWAGTPVLKRVHRINLKCLQAILRGMTVRDPFVDEIVSRHKELWAQMDERSAARAARNPVLLVDLHFQDSAWWRWIGQNAPKPLRAYPARDCVPVCDATALVREILHEVCVVGVSNPQAAKLAFGMSAAVIDVIAGLDASQLDRIGMENSNDLRLRWQENNVYWRNLLKAAMGESEEALAAVHMHSLQLLGSEGAAQI